VGINKPVGSLGVQAPSQLKASKGSNSRDIDAFVFYLEDTAFKASDHPSFKKMLRKILKMR
jgi:hypothetical protein